MAENSTTTAGEEEEKVAVISDSEGEDSIDETLDGSPLTLPPEVWAMVINCEYCNNNIKIPIMYLY